MKLVKFIKPITAQLAVAAIGLTYGFVALAQTAPNPYNTDVTTLTSSINWTNIIGGVLAVAVSLMGLYAVIKGVKIIMGMIKGR